MEPAITAIGTASPRYKQNQRSASEVISNLLNLNPTEKKLLKSLYRSTGIEYRYSVLKDFDSQSTHFEFYPQDTEAPFPSTSARMAVYKDNALHLALAAIHNCLAMLNDFNINDITHVVTVTCTGMYAPGLDIEIVQKLNLNSSVKRTAINFMGCYGAFNGIKVADAISRADPDAAVLVVCVELCTLHFQKKKRLDNLISNAIFADGAGCVLIQGKTKAKKYLCLKNFQCDLLPQSSNEMAWHIGDHGFDMLLSSYVPDLIKSGIAEFRQRLTESTNLKPINIDFYAIHPGGLKILQACEKALEIAEEANKYAYHILRNYGNMSSATILFVLKSIWDDLRHEDDHDKHIFSCAFGPGLTIEAMLLKTAYTS